MPERFRLEQLLRVRRLEEDRARGELLATRRRAAQLERRERRARAAVSDLPVEAASAEAVAGIAAARASSASMLAELAALDETMRAAVARDHAAHTAARARTSALEKLEGRHLEARRADVLRSEQHVLDEIAGRVRRERREA